MINKYFLVCDIASSPKDLPKCLSFISKATYNKENTITIETSKVSYVDIINRKIRKIKFINKCEVSKYTDTQWKFYGDDYPKKGDSCYQLSGFDGCMNFIYAFIASIEIAKDILNIDSNKFVNESLSQFETIFDKKYQIIETPYEIIHSLF